MVYDLEFMAFVCEYEDTHPGVELSKAQALKLYAEYDLQWEYAKKETRQFMRFARDSANNPLMGYVGNMIDKTGG